VLGQIGERVDQAFPIPGGQGVRARHGQLLPCAARRRRPIDNPVETPATDATVNSARELTRA
jgi:hypothetical protein